MWTPTRELAQWSVGEIGARLSKAGSPFLGLESVPLSAQAPVGTTLVDGTSERRSNFLQYGRLLKSGEE